MAGIECDVSSPASVQRLMSAAASQMGSVDVWINNAGNSGGFQVPYCVHISVTPPANRDIKLRHSGWGLHIPSIGALTHPSLACLSLQSQSSPGMLYPQALQAFQAFSTASAVPLLEQAVTGLQSER